MNLHQGMCICSTAAMDDDHFKNTIVLITEFNRKGTTGFILNRPFGKKLNELAEFRITKPFALRTGGPVDQEHLYFIHRQPGLISGGRIIGDGWYFGGNFAEAVEALNEDLLMTNDLKIFIGYCGWDAGELEAEIAEGSWEVVA